jgi:very-short-patch-repair endonuclease
MRKNSHLEQRFEHVISVHQLPEPVREYTFYGYRYDFAWPQLKIAVEIDGGTFSGGNHVRGVGYSRDCRKNNLAQSEGWIVLRADRTILFEKEFVQIVKKIIVMRINQCTTARRLW